MTKNELRNKYRALRASLTSQDIEEKSLQIANQLLQLSVWDYSFYHIFLSIIESREVQTEPILSILNGLDKNVVIPKTNIENQSLTHYLLTDNTLIRKNQWNIPEPVDGIQISPEQIKVVFIPLLAFDIKGNRVGYGKGFYDRFLVQCKPETVKIGLSFFEAEMSISDAKGHDIKLDYCVTPKRILSF